MATPGGSPREVHQYVAILTVLGGFATPALVFLTTALKAMGDRRKDAQEQRVRAALDKAQADFQARQTAEIERLARERDFWEMTARRADSMAHMLRHALANTRHSIGDTRPIPPVPKLEDKFTEKELKDGEDYSTEG